MRVEPYLPDAIETAVSLAETDLEGELSGVGMLITGSVVTVADARTLLAQMTGPTPGPRRSGLEEPGRRPCAASARPRSRPRAW